MAIISLVNLGAIELEFFSDIHSCCSLSASMTLPSLFNADAKPGTGDSGTHFRIWSRDTASSRTAKMRSLSTLVNLCIVCVCVSFDEKIKINPQGMLCKRTALSLSLSKRKRTHPSYETVKREMFVVPLPFGRARWTGVFDSNRTTRERERERVFERSPRAHVFFFFSVDFRTTRRRRSRRRRET